MSRFVSEMIQERAIVTVVFPCAQPSVCAVRCTSESRAYGVGSLGCIVSSDI